MAQYPPSWCQWWPKNRPIGAPTGSKRPQEAPRSPKEGPRTSQEATRDPKEEQRGSQEAHKKTQGPPKTLSRSAKMLLWSLQNLTILVQHFENMWSNNVSENKCLIDFHRPHASIWPYGQHQTSPFSLSRCDFLHVRSHWLFCEFPDARWSQIEVNRVHMYNMQISYSGCSFNFATFKAVFWVGGLAWKTFEPHATI